jgi:hypothetical protein
MALVLAHSFGPDSDPVQPMVGGIIGIGVLGLLTWLLVATKKRSTPTSTGLGKGMTKL